jgi:hypothetical protein
MPVEKHHTSEGWYYQWGNTAKYFFVLMIPIGLWRKRMQDGAVLYAHGYAGNDPAGRKASTHRPKERMLLTCYDYSISFLKSQIPQGKHLS